MPLCVWKCLALGRLHKWQLLRHSAKQQHQQPKLPTPSPPPTPTPHPPSPHGNNSFLLPLPSLSPNNLFLTSSHPQLHWSGGRYGGWEGSDIKQDIFLNLEKTSMTLMAVLQLRATLSLPDAPSLPLLAPALLETHSVFSVPEPLASRSHRTSFLELTLQEVPLGRKVKGRSWASFLPLTLFCPLPLPTALCAFPSLVSSKEHKDLLSLSGHRGLKLQSRPHFLPLWNPR